ncbi:MAG: hypothetical protein VR68_14640 [Peptococcaceae bacterium BRH_c4a]|nr:MAG: hypothetical protein VR68_14640 [Peptococcaceae bacterium BRH_c4a]
MNHSFTGEKKEKLKRLEEVFQEVARNISVKIFQGADQNLTHPQFFMLKRLGKGSSTVSEMAEYLGVSLSAITSMADRLVKTGYVSRKRSEHDRRLVWLELTDTGREVMEETTSRRREIINGLLGRLPEEDLESLYVIYHKVLGFISEKAEK